MSGAPTPEVLVNLRVRNDIRADNLTATSGRVQTISNANLVQATLAPGPTIPLETTATPTTAFAFLQSGLLESGNSPLEIVSGSGGALTVQPGTTFSSGTVRLDLRAVLTWTDTGGGDALAITLRLQKNGADLASLLVDETSTTASIDNIVTTLIKGDALTATYESTTLGGDVGDQVVVDGVFLTVTTYTS